MVFVLVAAAVAMLVMLGRTNFAPGAAALDAVEKRTRPVLALEVEHAEALGEHLEVSWTPRPCLATGVRPSSPASRAAPSRAVRNDKFMVMSDGRVMAMNQTAQRLITRSTAGEGRTMTMEDGSKMPMP